jgi:hypothetical protein
MPTPDATARELARSNAAAVTHAEPHPLPQLLPTAPAPAREIGGRDGPEPTRFGDWERAGRCIDF